MAGVSFELMSCVGFPQLLEHGGLCLLLLFLRRRCGPRPPFLSSTPGTQVSVPGPQAPGPSARPPAVSSQAGRSLVPPSVLSLLPSVCSEFGFDR